jgi:hypothetical protein
MVRPDGATEIYQDDEKTVCGNLYGLFVNFEVLATMVYAACPS